MADDKLAVTNGSNAIEKSSPNTAKLATAYGLDLSAAIFGKDLTGVEVDFWQQALGKYKPEHIARAFKRHCADSMYFPKPGEIREIIREFMRDEQPTVGEIYRRQLAEPSRFDAENEDKK